MNYSSKLKKVLLQNAIDLAKKYSYRGEVHKTAFIFDKISDNFYTDSYNNIDKISEYKVRLEKQHSHFAKELGIREMQSSNSSDTLLMNIFTYPNILKWKSIRDLLSVNEYDKIEFGWNPGFENETSRSTEIDMRIGDVIFEAKLTEQDFTSKELSIVRTYHKVDDIIDLKLLLNRDRVSNYQLIRNVLAAHRHDYRFFLLLDERRIDLIRKFFDVKLAIKNVNLQNRCEFITWQELTSCLGKYLKQYITEKYF